MEAGISGCKSREADGGSWEKRGEAVLLPQGEAGREALRKRRESVRREKLAGKRLWERPPVCVEKENGKWTFSASSSGFSDAGWREKPAVWLREVGGGKLVETGEVGRKAFGKQLLDLKKG